MIELKDIITAPKEESSPTVSVSTGYPSSFWFVLGLSAGFVGAVFLVNSQRGKNRKNGKRTTKIPGSGSPT